MRHFHLQRAVFVIILFLLFELYYTRTYLNNSNYEKYYYFININLLFINFNKYYVKYYYSKLEISNSINTKKRETL